jgi:hypothetical protein
MTNNHETNENASTEQNYKNLKKYWVFLPPPHPVNAFPASLVMTNKRTQLSPNTFEKIKRNVYI